MGEKLIIRGETPLTGEVKISGAKNAALPLMAACLLIEDECKLQNIPRLTDIDAIGKTLQELGAKVEVNKGHLKVNSSTLAREQAPDHLVNMLRASVLVLGPLLVRRQKAKLSLPGGCNIGSRPINLHLKAFASMGAHIDTSNGYIEAKAPSPLKGANIYLDFPSVGATENILLAASLAKGTTVIKNASRTPEVVDLCNFLKTAGAKISGTGTSTLKVEGVRYLSPVNYSIIPDRIEAGTFMIAACITGGELLLKNVNPEHLQAAVLALKSMKAEVEAEDNTIRIKGSFPLKSVKVSTSPHPGFPTDLQPQLTSLACMAKGESRITETIFESRFSHVFELKKMGARIQQQGTKIKIDGVKSLQGAQITASDIRGGAALVLAGLAARGETQMSNPNYINRGYEKFREKLCSLGANIKREAG